MEHSTEIISGAAEGISADVATDNTPQPNRQNNSGGFVTRAEVARMISESLLSLRVYVLESDITEAQNSTKAIIDRASF